ncbi:hypothetical protein [uncultured Roseobacter sp.]|uniref:hypothetical protein n=1 Tax=uncultured Roseobacter sp. TaxID=114847 RepID=UPI00262A89C8|nr:hypothetical protein [uncultured Roseobacter sp.]
MSINLHYTREILEELNYVATWFPTTTLAPGEVCDMRGGQLKPVGSLEDFDITFETEPGSAESTIEYKSAGAVSIKTKAAGSAELPGSALKEAEAGLHITFARENAILLTLTGCEARRIARLHQVGQQVLAKHNEGAWPKGYVVVTEALTCGASTILVASSDNAAIDLSAKGAFGAMALTLANANAGLEMRTESNIGFRTISSPGLTPLLRTSGIVPRFLRPDEFRGGAEEADVDFAAVSYDDLEE